MQQNKTPGLFKRGTIWHIDKQLLGVRVRESTKTTSLNEANRYIAHVIEAIRQTQLYGMRLKRSFHEAAIKYCQEHQHKRSFEQDVRALKLLNTYLGDMPLERIHRGTLEEFIHARRQQGVKNRTINHGLQTVRRLLNLAATEWFDDNGLSWLPTAPKIKLLPIDDARKPYPLSWQEEAALFQALPPHLKKMALFAVNTGCRDHEVCSLRWAWEKKVPELNTSVFIIPAKEVKNKLDRLVVLNHTAREVIEAVRGKDATYVFTYRGKPIVRMLNSGWKTAREKAALPFVRVHDLKHTFGRRLRAAGVSFEDRQDLLGHKSARITTHYSAPELSALIKAANTVTQTMHSTTSLTLL